MFNQSPRDEISNDSQSSSYDPQKDSPQCIIERLIHDAMPSTPIEIRHYDSPAGYGVEDTEVKPEGPARDSTAS